VKTKNPLVSVIIPVYNTEAYLKRCLDSVHKQTYLNIEVLLVNDGSTDNSQAILEEFHKRDKRFMVLKKENGGLSDARNYGMDRAKGEYYFFVDSDDLIEKKTVELMMKAINKENAEIAVCDMSYLYPDGHTSFSSGGSFSCTSVEKDHSLLFINNSANNKIFHASLFNDLRFPQGMWYEDLAVIPTLLTKADRVVKVDESLYYYYQREGSLAHSTNEHMFDLYDSIDMVKKAVQEKIQDTSFMNRMYLIHGLDMTTMRIKDSYDKNRRVSFLKRNIQKLDEHYPDWRNDPELEKFDKKKRFIFKLLAKGYYRLALLIFDLRKKS
jgi:glycosyltransferase involved in cell wall biosynthesis